ncbi:o-succinylbenzoate synthase [Yaniella halotolerans]|uniref:o-succinylbenzoate synthase n=1 Tax=Yaniella halotolerans TaxID=225453 RepID=UPI0003B75668|nr:o-succinylbenzoate synthase [Yaniella halotolerans]
MVDNSHILPLNADVELEELAANAVAIGLPMNTKFRKTTLREVMLIKGPHGWAEFSPFPEYAPEESAAWLSAAIEAGWHGWPEPVRQRVPVNATVPAVAVDDVETVLARFGPVSAVKVKVADPNVATDIARVKRVRELLPEADIRIDANAGYTHQQAFEVIMALDFLTYAEQPVAGIQPLAELRADLRAAGSRVLIAADEAVRKATDPLAVAQAGAADLIVVKVQPLGGVRRALSIVEASGLDAVVSSALDSSVGIAAGVALAASLPTLDHACGLATAALFTTEPANPARAGEGALTAGPAPQPDPAIMEQLKLPAERQAWWQTRLAETHSVLSAKA